MNTTLSEWLELVQQEYLEDFISLGGAAVKFAVPLDSATHTQLPTSLRRLADSGGFAFAAIDATSTKAHMVDQVFYEIARQVDWGELAFSFTSRLLADQGYSCPGDRAEFNLRAIAALNGREETLLRKDLNGWLEAQIYRDYRMSQEFRLAMISLCLGALDIGTSTFVTTAVKEWLRGELRYLSAVRGALIFQKIARHNARHILFSLAHWTTLCGKRGLLLMKDISRYTVAKRPKEPDGTFYYSSSAVVDGHEVLRQFIDGTDEVECFLLVVVASREFLGNYQRGINCYDALRLRISDEVRDKRRANPLACVVSLSL